MNEPESFREIFFENMKVQEIFKDMKELESHRKNILCNPGKALFHKIKRGCFFSKVKKNLYKVPEQF